MKTQKRPKKQRICKLRLNRETLQRLHATELREIGGGRTGQTCPVVSWCLC